MAHERGHQRKMASFPGTVACLDSANGVPHRSWMAKAAGRAHWSPLLLASFLILAIVSGCAGEPARPMAGVNRTDKNAFVRLVIKDGGFGDFLLPANSTVLLTTDLNVDRAVTFDETCHETGTVVFGNPQVDFSAGGQIFLGPKNEGGMTNELPAEGFIPGAAPTDVCANAPTPADPRDRVPLAGGGVQVWPQGSPP